jgi:ABC-type glycerol-3-phosphate transport system substrate-binding protein
VAKFKAKYPGVKVEFVTAGWDVWETKLLAAASAGEPIDMLNDGANNNPKFALKGITQPVEAYINMDNPNLHKTTMDAVFKYNGHYYVAASETNAAVIYYNKTLFDNEGVEMPEQLAAQGKWDYENFVRIAKKLTNSSLKRFGLAADYPYVFFGANKTSVLSLNESKKYELNINAPELKQSLELIQDGWYLSKWSGYDMDPRSSFYKGTAAMLADFQWIDRSILEAQQYNLVNFEYGVVSMPFGPNNTDGVSPVTAAGWAIGNGADCPWHSGKLIDMLVDGQAAYTEIMNKKLDPAHAELYQELIKKPFCTNSYDSAVGGAYELATAVIEGKSIAQAVEEMKPVYQRMVDEANKAAK